ncbi:hypothetical protein AB0C68_04240 [Streptomyces tendae]|uniref:hypothetical protein n=1 Tax=Streptomyces tendae TaxID=1932 RepID=UPI0033C60D17
MTPSGPAAEATAGHPAGPGPAVSFDAVVSGDRLRFARAPRTRVSFPGTGTRESVSRTARTNLPLRVAPGQDYREVTVEYHLASRLTGASDTGRVPDDDSPAE